MMSSTVLRMESVPDCLLCGAEGVAMYKDLEDRLYGVPGKFSLSQCPQCGFMWLNPRPIHEDIPKCYINYYTHDASNPMNENGDRLYGNLRDEIRRLVLEAYYDWPKLHPESRTRFLMGRILGALPPLRRRAAYGLDVLFPPWHGEGRLLDVGCGNGIYLAQMRKLGWRVMGVEIDSRAAKFAQQRYEIPVVAGTLQEAEFPDSSFDAITMNHVLEHIADPLALLKECHRLLSLDGYLAIVVPNLESLGHGLFHEHWRGLEPPRHLSLWRITNLRHSVEAIGFCVQHCKTRSNLAEFIWEWSIQISRVGKVKLNGLLLPQTARIFRWIERTLMFFNPKVGEEICLLARKK